MSQFNSYRQLQLPPSGTGGAVSPEPGARTISRDLCGLACITGQRSRSLASAAEGEGPAVRAAPLASHSFLLRLRSGHRKQKDGPGWAQELSFPSQGDCIVCKPLIPHRLPTAKHFN